MTEEKQEDMQWTRTSYQDVYCLFLNYRGEITWYTGDKEGP